MPPAAQALPALPFTASAHEHVELAATLTVTPTTAVQQLNPIDIPASGYFRSLFIEIVAAGGAGGTLAADGPWNIISSLALKDVNGSHIISPIDGYALYCANLFGGFDFNNNLANVPWYSGSAPNPAFGLRVPVEVIARDGLGALANQNSAANYKLEMAINSIAGQASVAYTTAPVFTIRVWYEGWTLPAAQSMRGEPQAQVPPLLGTGQYLNAVTRPVVVGTNNTPVNRVGNLIRNLILIGRDVSGVRQDTVLPDMAELRWDGNAIFTSSVRYLKAYAMQKLAGAVTFPTGVVVFPFSHLLTGRMGNESPDLWLPTTQSTRLEVVGPSAVAGNIQLVVNDVAPVEQTQTERYQVPNDTGRLNAPAQ